MADRPSSAATSYLRLSDKGHRRDWQQQARLVVAAGGPGPWRQLWDLTRLALSGSPYKAEDYYRFGMWKGGVGRAHREGFVAKAEQRAYNVALHDPGSETDEAVARDKLKTEARLIAAGLACVRTRAAVGVAGELPSHVQRIGDAAALDAYLADPAHYPVFVKPLTGTDARGTAAFTGLEGDRIVLSNGLRAPRAAIVNEMMREPDGYLLQPPVAAAPEIARHAGRAMPSLRVTTLRMAEGVEPWYAAIRLPAPTQMSDGGSVNLRVWSEVDLADGRPLQWRRVGSPYNAVPAHWADKSVPLSEMRVPGMAGAVDLAVAGHALFPRLGIVGWDIFVTAEGSLLNEANATPFPLLQGVTAVGQRTGAAGETYRKALSAARARRG